MYVGDIRINQVVNYKFTTVNSGGVATAFVGAPVVAAYKSNSTTQTTNGITVTTEFDGLNGLHNILVDTSQDPTFYATASDIEIVILAGTVSGNSLTGYVPMAFSIENRTGFLNSSERNAIADAWLDRDMSLGIDSGSSVLRTPRQAMRFLRNKWTILNNSLSVKKEDDSTESWTAAVGTTTNADGVSSLDPAGP